MFFSDHSDSRGYSFRLQRDSFGLQRDSFGLQRDSFRLQRDPFGLQRDSFGLQRDSLRLQRDSFRLQRDSFGLQRDSFRLILAPGEPDTYRPNSQNGTLESFVQSNQVSTLALGSRLIIYDAVYSLGASELKIASSGARTGALWFQKLFSLELEVVASEARAG